MVEFLFPDGSFFCCLIVCCAFFFTKIIQFYFYFRVVVRNALNYAVVSIIFKNYLGKSCPFEKVNITLTSEHWNETLMSRESNEFRSLERNILSAVCYLILFIPIIHS